MITGKKMARHKLTETKIKALDKPGVYSDGDGLYLRVQKGGSKNWVFVWRRGAMRNERGLGGYGQGTAPVSLALAREKASKIRAALAAEAFAPVDDSLLGIRADKPVTFGDAVRDLLRNKESGWRNLKHAQQWAMTLNEYAKPLHGLPVAEIRVSDVKRALLPHWTERPETADRLRMRISAVLDFAEAHEMRKGANPARKAVIEKIMPARLNREDKHHAALAYSHMPQLMQGLRKSAGTAAKAVEFIVLTVGRTAEIRGAEFSEFDLAEKVWTVPASRMKMKKEHAVPLCDRASDIIRELEKRATSSFVFGGGHDGKPVSDTAMTKALRLASPDKAATLHGLRSSFRDWVGDQTEFPRELAEQALAHAVGDKTERAYRRGDALDRRRELMTAWAQYCQ